MNEGNIRDGGTWTFDTDGELVTLFRDGHVVGYMSKKTFDALRAGGLGDGKQCPKEVP